MPNWCCNKITFKGGVAAVKDFLMERKLAFHRENDEGQDCFFSFRDFLPIPIDIDDEEDWCRDNWGTKWDVSWVGVVYKEESVELWFETAWAPPSDELIGAISRKFPASIVRLDCDEEGVGFQGEEEWQNGECLFSECREEDEYKQPKWPVDFEQFVQLIVDGASEVEAFAKAKQSKYV